MNRSLAAAFLLLFLSDARAQAILPPVRPPMVRPAVNEPYFPTPGATPNGAGASHGSLPGAATPPQAKVPPSPNKSVKAVSAGHELWAADGAPRAATPPRLFGVDLVFPKDAGALFEREEAFICMSIMTRAVKKIGADATVQDAPPPARACIAAQAFAFCLRTMHEDLAAKKRAGSFDQSEFDAVQRMTLLAEALANTACGGARLLPKETKVLDDLALYILGVVKGTIQP